MDCPKCSTAFGAGSPARVELQDETVDILGDAVGTVGTRRQAHHRQAAGPVRHGGHQEPGDDRAQVAEQELPSIEEFVEYGSQRRINIVVYNNYDEMQQSNIGLGIDWQNTGGVTKLVNNKAMAK